MTRDGLRRGQREVVQWPPPRGGVMMRPQRWCGVTAGDRCCRRWRRDASPGEQAVAARFQQGGGGVSATSFRQLPYRQKIKSKTSPFFFCGKGKLHLNQRKGKLGSSLQDPENLFHVYRFRWRRFLAQTSSKWYSLQSIIVSKKTKTLIMDPRE